MTDETTHLFQERILTLMDNKHHWAWPHFTGPTLPTERLKTHFQQEWAVYVRDFPVLLARVHGKNPPWDVRHDLAENIYEEDTGKLSVGRSHPELFLEMMEGLGFKGAEFENVHLLPASQAYRRWLDDITGSDDWLVSVAVLTIFVEGSINDRHEIRQPSLQKTREQIESAVDRHPLVRHHGVPPARMDLIRAHQTVEAGHRQAAYGMVSRHARSSAQQSRVLDALASGLDRWLHYRDDVASACGLTRSI